MHIGNIVTTAAAEAHPPEPAVQRLWLVRHGVTPWNQERRLCGHQDQPLAPTGLQQAERVAHYLANRTLVAIYSSDLLRARHTAQIIARRQETSPLLKESPLWREMSFGEWEGLRYQDIIDLNKDHASFFTDPLSSPPPGGESLLHVVARTRTAFLTLARDAAVLAAGAIQGDMVVVGHGGALRAMLCGLFDIPLKRQWQFRIDHGSISALDFVPTADNVLETLSLSLLNMVPDTDRSPDMAGKAG